MYDLRKQGVDFHKVLALSVKWPVYAFRLLRRGRFETIAQLRRDGHHLDLMFNPKGPRMMRSDSNPDFFKGKGGACVVIVVDSLVNLHRRKNHPL
jgi:hypothetical protein